MKELNDLYLKYRDSQKEPSYNKMLLLVFTILVILIFTLGVLE